MKEEIVRKLKQEILAMQGVQPKPHGRPVDTGLGAITKSFPYRVFPTGIHEFISTSSSCAAATSGFMSALLGKLTRPGDTYVWIGSQRQLFPPALSFFGVNPDQVIFIDSKKQSDVSWMIEQALKCPSLGAVIGEITELDLAQSRRLQLAAEQSRVNCFLHRYRPRLLSGLASVCRWRIQPIRTSLPDGLPGVGFPTWDITLEKVRNGHPGNWQYQWANDHFEAVTAITEHTAGTDTDHKYMKRSWSEIA